MLDRIADRLRQSDYDFRAHANPDDPLAMLFAEWVPNYRLKRAIAAELAPRSILEIGVRYGYSARAFLDAAPKAKFLGLDLEVERHGGVQSGLEWARKLLAPFEAQLQLGDSQALDELPGESWDLVHVDGQQDGDGTFHDLELAIGKAGAILVDGYLWTELNFQAANEFLFQYREAIRDWSMIPGYAGELLIRVDRASPLFAPAPAAFDQRFFSIALPGAHTFKVSEGALVTEPRHRHLLHGATLHGGKRALDLGCGRGEIARQLAASGFEVVAVDRSPDALAHARRACAQSPGVRFVEGDATRVGVEGPFDVVIAGRLLDAVAPEDRDALVDRMAASVGPQGVVLLAGEDAPAHARAQASRRRLARTAGVWLSPRDHSLGERVRFPGAMGLAKLHRALVRRFAFAAVFPASLAGGGQHAWLALASHGAEPPAWLAKSLLDDASGRSQADHVRIESLSCPARMRTGEESLARMTLSHAGSAALLGVGRHPVSLSYHWARAGDPAAPRIEGHRTALPVALTPGARREFTFAMRAPDDGGAWRLEATLVQEFVCWFDEVNDAARAVADVHVENAPRRARS